MCSNARGTEDQKNFVDAGSKIKADVEIVLPMFGNAKDFTFGDTTNFRFQKVDNITSINFRAFVVNDFPMDVTMQIYFTDSAYNKIDSLFNEPPSANQTNVIPSAQITFNPDGSQSSIASQKLTDVNYNQTRALALKKAHFIIIKAISATFGNGTKNVKIYSDKRLSVKLGARAQMNIKIK